MRVQRAEFTQICSGFYQGVEISGIQKHVKDYYHGNAPPFGRQPFYPSKQKWWFIPEERVDMCVGVVMCRFRPLHHLSDRAVRITEALFQNARPILVRVLSYSTCTRTSGDSRGLTVTGVRGGVCEQLVNLG